MDPEEEAAKAAAMLAAGVPIVIIQHELGHATINETVEKYGHLIP